MDIFSEVFVICLFTAFLKYAILIIIMGKYVLFPVLKIYHHILMENVGKAEYP